MKKINQYRKQIVCLFAAIAMITYLSIAFMPTHNDQQLVIADEKKPAIQVFMLDQDETLVPLSIPIDVKMNVKEKLKAMVNYMNQDHLSGSFHKIFQKNAKLNNVTIQKGLATLDFNSAFSSYDAKQELRVLESLVWGATQFPEVQSVAVCVEGKPLDSMPVASTPIPKKLDRTLGINNFETTSAKLFESQPVTVFYTKEINQETYYVPKTNRIQSTTVSINDQVSAILDDIRVTSGLTQPLFADQVEMTKDAYMENQTLVVNLNQNILSEDRAAKEAAYETLVLSLAEITGVDEVKVCVDDVVISLHGSNEEAVSVSSLSYNRIAM